MMYETDIPCSDCGTALVETTVSIGDLAVSTSWRGTVTVAECPECGARYYPEQTVTDLFEAVGGG